ncbi:MAG: ABC transporter ATP-binding protein [Crocinitomicaceae bacterium]|nr:ABC transporter ATP-binding protein [Crocinitomicaceae bacterium]MBK8924863.1 ABC transporter ATP-binding protein [Crocinitomicaceae bacterium]
MSALFYLNKYLLRYKWRLLLGSIFIVVKNIFLIQMPLVVEDTINKVKEATDTGGNKEMSEVLEIGLLAAGLFILLALLSGLFSFMTRQTIIIMSRLVEYDLKNEIYHHYQQLSFTFYKKNATGDLMNRISEDVSHVRMYLGPGIMYTIDLLFLFTLTLYQMVNANAELTLYVLLPLPLMSLLIYLVSSTLNKKSTKVQASQSRLSTQVQESFSGIRIIKSFASDKNARLKFDHEAEQYKKESMKLSTTNAFFMPTIILLIGVATILTVYVGGLQTQQGFIEAGEIAEFVIYVNMLTWPFASVGWVTSIIQRAAASQARINEFLKEQPEIVSTSEKNVLFEKEISFNQVSLKYANTGITAVDQLNFTLPKGKTFGILGKTGSGKSSVAYLMMRLIDPTGGKIEVEGQDLKKLNLTDWRNKIGYVPQEHFLFSDSIRNNILFGVSEQAETDSDQLEERMIHAARAAGIHDTVLTFPDGYNTLLGERGINLSGGQKQRVSIARALMKNPEILVLDDCLSAVDNETEEQILKAIRADIINKTAIIISHRISSIKYADTILVMENGKIAEQGSHEELLAMNGIYTEIYKKQQVQENQQKDKE